ncbi:MAG: amidohydrolase family protein [Clostridia bacterium]|nr:amidohydrolase family protein [Clostridia bacterium]
MTTKIINANIVTPEGILSDATVVFEDGILTYIGDLCPESDRTFDAEGNYLLAGFIDIHCHGGNGHDFMDASTEEMREIARFHLSHGTTTLVATTLTDTWEHIEGALSRFASLGDDTLTLHGVHMEGPWFSPSQSGAQSTSQMEMASLEKLKELKAKYPFIERISLAPEVDENFDTGSGAKALGMVVALAHTDADFDLTERAVAHGYSLVTHIYSGMRGVVRENAYRIAGCVEASLYDDNLAVEVIADGKHLPGGLLKLIYKCKGADKICLITDGTRGCGMTEGEMFMLGTREGGTPAVIEDGVAKLPSREAFAGSVATTDRLARTMHMLADVPFVELSEMMSATPARVMGYSDRGRIAVGLRADLVIMDENCNIKQVFLKGELQ